MSGIKGSEIFQCQSLSKITANAYKQTFILQPQNCILRFYHMISDTLGIFLIDPNIKDVSEKVIFQIRQGTLIFR